MFWKKKEKREADVEKGKREEREVTDQAEGNGSADIVWLRRVLSHNVRMPMSVIEGYGELLQQGLATEEEKEGIIQSICENITYMNEVLGIVFEEEKPLGLQRVDVAALACRMQGYVQEMAKRSGIIVSVSTERKNLYITAEPIPVMRIFYHLFENAFKYLERQSHVWITIYAVENRQVLIVFKDDGAGMEEREAERIFEKDFRGSNSEGKRGSGLGMFAVKQLVECYGGTVRVSSHLGGGLSVYIVFPMEGEGE